MPEEKDTYDTLQNDVGNFVQNAKRIAVENKNLRLDNAQLKEENEKLKQEIADVIAKKSILVHTLSALVEENKEM